MTSRMSMCAETMLRPAVFLDKDRTLLADVPYNLEPLLMRLASGAREALEIFAALGVYVISNQSGVALGRFAIDALDAVDKRLRGNETVWRHGPFREPDHPLLRIFIRGRWRFNNARFDGS